MSLGPDNRSRGYGTVLLATAEDAGRAVDTFNGYCWQTRVLEVRPDRLGATLDAELNINSSFPNPSVPFVQQGINIPVLSALNNLDEFAMSIPGNGELLSGGTGMRTLFVGNVRFLNTGRSLSPAVSLTRFLSYPSTSNGKISKISSVPRVLSHVQTLLLALTADLVASAR